MKRHEEFNKTKFTTHHNGLRKLVYQTNIFPKIDRHETDIYIHVRDGDRLDNLAFRYYGDASLWWVIATANGLGKGRTILNPNFKIRIPGNLQSILADFDSLNG